MTLFRLCAIFLWCSHAAAETITYVVPKEGDPATLHMVKESLTNNNDNYQAAVQGCTALGGELAPVWLAPDRMIKFTCKATNGGDDGDEAFVKADSQGCLKIENDQSHM